MKNNRGYLLLSFIAFISLGISQPRMGMNQPDPVDWVKKLDLNEKQATQMKEINERLMAELKDLREDPNMDFREKRYEMSDKMQERDKLIKGILTEKQYKQYQNEKKSQQKERGRSRRGPRQN